MKRLALLAALLFATPAFAAEPQHYPSVLIDADCADSFNAGGVSSIITSRFWTSTNQTQTTGTADGLCDIDNRILASTTAITADKSFGADGTTAAVPFDLPVGSVGLLIHADGDTVSGGITDWKVCVLEDMLHESGTKKVVWCGGTNTGTTDQFLMVGALGVGTTSISTLVTYTSHIAVLPRHFYLQLDLISATSWAGSLSWQYTN
jgi:hypothetical protein